MPFRGPIPRWRSCWEERNIMSSLKLGHWFALQARRIYGILQKARWTKLSWSPDLIHHTCRWDIVPLKAPEWLLTLWFLSERPGMSWGWERLRRCNTEGSSWLSAWKLHRISENIDTVCNQLLWFCFTEFYKGCFYLSENNDKSNQRKESQLLRVFRASTRHPTMVTKIVVKLVPTSRSNLSLLFFCNAHACLLLKRFTMTN